MAIIGSCVPKMEKPCLWIAASLEPATSLYTQDTRKGRTKRLAGLASPHSGDYHLIIRRGRHCCSTRPEQSRMSSHPPGPCGSGIGKSVGGDAGAIPGADISGAHLRW